MTQTVGGQPVNPTSSATGAGIASRIAGQAIRGVASRLITVSSAEVKSNYATPGQTLVGLDTAPDQPVSARSIAGPLPVGMRVVVLLYPPRGILILGPIGIRTDNSPAMTTYTAASTSYAKPAGLVAARVRVIGGGGAGGGAAATGVGQASMGSGGQAGHYAESFLLGGAIPDTGTITVATAAAGVAGGTGTAGSASSFLGLVVATGGNAGSTQAAGAGPATRQPGASGNIAGSIGQIIVVGGDGDNALQIAATIAAGGNGGSSVLGGGGRGGAPGNGVAGWNYGGGGGGSANQASEAARAGGNGGPGIVLVEHFFGG
jgi:hypothetical protein